MSEATHEHKVLKEILSQILVCVAVVSLVTAFFTAARIAGSQETIRHVDPLNQRALQHLKKAASRYPRDEALKDAFREIDTAARRQFYRAKTFGRRGAIILTVACGLFLVCVQVLARLLRSPSRPGTAPDKADPAGVLVRRGLLAGGVTAVVFALALGQAGRLDEGETRPGNGREGTGGRRPKAPAFDAHDGQWVGFRGTGGQGIATDDPVPTAWDGASGQGILWKVKPPKAGFSSPVIYDGRLFLTGADDSAREVYCYDTETGVLLWRADTAGILGSPAKLPDVSEDTGFAAATAATDGRRVYAIFATGDIVCLDLEGQRLWARNLGLPDNPYGHSSSLAVHRNTVLIQYDHFESARLLGLDVSDGTTRWEQKRDVSASWASPILVRLADRVVAVVNAEPFVEAFDVESGERLWSSECMAGEVGPSPAFTAGLAFVTTDYATLAAIRVGGEGAGNVIWRTDEELPDVASPVAHAGLLFTATSAGILSCYDAKDGSVQWREELPQGYYSSPIIAAGALYLTDRDGETRIYKVERKARLLAANALGEAVVATPAFWQGRIYLRGVQNLYCIGK